MEMDLTTRIIAIVVLILFSGYFSMAEISLAASPKVKLHQALDAGDKRAQKVLDLQVKPGPVLFGDSNWPKCYCHLGRYYRRDTFFPVL